MENKLLDLRFDVHGLLFKKAGNNTEISAAWSKVALDLSLFSMVHIPKDSVVSKFQQMKRDYLALSNKPTETGNKTNDPIVYPGNWDRIHSHFSRHDGAGGLDLGQSDQATPALFHLGSDDDRKNCPSSVRKTRKSDISESVEGMAAAISKGFDTLAILNTPHSSSLEKTISDAVSRSVDDGLDKINGTLAKAFADQAQTQRELLEFLRSNQR